MDLKNNINPTKSTVKQSTTNSSIQKSGNNSGNGNSSSARIPFYEGQVIKGEITDLRNNKVTIALENNTYITGTVENASDLSIGETGVFKILEISPRGVTLQARQASSQVMENVTIAKALEAAGLPKNEKNQAIVHELLQNQLSINKQSILTILNQSYEFKNVSISTLVLMNKHKLPLTEQNVTQFENYRNYEHRVIREIETLTEGLPDLLEHLSVKSDSKTLQTLGNQLLSFTLDSTHITNSSSDPSFYFLKLSYDERQELIQTMDGFSLSDDLKYKILNGTANLREVVQTLHENITMAGEIDRMHLEEAINTKMTEKKMTTFTPEQLATMTEELKSELPLTSDAFQSTTIRKVFEQYGAFQFENGELASFLSESSRHDLSDKLRLFPLSPALMEKIESGEATTKSVLNAIKNSFPMTQPDSVRDLFVSKEFKSLYKEGLLANWTVTPKTLMQQNEVDSLYTKLYDHLSKISELMQNNINNPSFETLNMHAGNMKDNLDFMKLLNNMFAYVQIPVKLKDQNIHSDLYVYTNKNNLKKNPKSISVLLHLDMESLGPLDVKINLDNNQINSTFYITDDFSTSLIANNLDILQDALGNRGYHFQARIEKRETEVDIVKDFIEKDLPSTSLKRYTFDIRA